MQCKWFQDTMAKWITILKYSHINTHIHQYKERNVHTKGTVKKKNTTHTHAHAHAHTIIVVTDCNYVFVVLKTDAKAHYEAHLQTNAAFRITSAYKQTTYLRGPPSWRHWPATAHFKVSTLTGAHYNQLYSHKSEFRLNVAAIYVKGAFHNLYLNAFDQSCDRRQGFVSA